MIQKARIEITLQHGWAYDSSCWVRWIKYIQDRWSSSILVQTNERGYFDSKIASRNNNLSDAIPKLRILISHSFGLHLVEPSTYQYLIVLNGFLSIHPEESGEKKRSQKLINRMRQKFNQSPLIVLNDFYSRNVITKSPTAEIPFELEQQLYRIKSEKDIAFDLLAKDLETMDQERLNTEILDSVPNVLFLHGNEDCIVSGDQAKALAQCLPNSELIIVDGAGHALPFSHHLQCLNIIENKLNIANLLVDRQDKTLAVL